MKNIYSALSLVTLGFFSLSAQAGTHFDSHGNIGYDTLEECHTAIKTGTAKFYQSSTFHKPLIRAGEVSVEEGILGNLAPEYANGTCDIGTGRRGQRDGVARALQGKYIPYSPNMAINQYKNSEGRIVRISMRQCDNWFSGAFPTGMPLEKAPEPIVVHTPAPVTPPPEIIVIPEPVPVVTPTPVTPPPMAAVGAAQGSIPLWVPVTAVGVIGLAIATSGGDDSSSTPGTTGTTGTR